MEELMENMRQTTTIAVHKTTKELLDNHKAPGQSYNGFIYELVCLWAYKDKVIATKRGLHDQEEQSVAT